MSSNSVFNATVCLIGIIILSVHIASVLFKRNRRKDENFLLAFFVFTLVHFATYLTFTLIKVNYTSDPYIIGFYTVFFIMNNGEVLLLFLYFLAYLDLKLKARKTMYFLNISLFGLFVMLDFVNILTHMFFNAVDGEYVRAKTMFIAQGYEVIILVLVAVMALASKKFNIRERVAFCLYCFIPLVTVILQIIFKGYAIAYVGIILSVEILFFFINVEKNRELSIKDEKNKEAQIKLMMSQIQPHFVYNVLSSISTLIPLDPEKAQTALDDFTEYLRGNLSALTETRLIPFEYELKHIKTYVSLEKLRFENRVKVIYNIRKSDFEVPCLSIQPIVENAIKHGILKRIEGGIVVISAYDDAEYNIIEIKDDGVGFDVARLDLSDNAHVGISNIKYRIENMGHGEINIYSENDRGTTVVVKFKK